MPIAVKPITSRQREALDFINAFVLDKRYAPSLRDLAKFLGTENLSTAQYFVNELKEKGYLKKTAGKARGIHLVSDSHSVPVLGYIAAGKPIEPIENPEEIIVPENIKIDARYPHYALKVKGDSMIDMGILDNDIVLIKHQMTADIGDTVVGITEKGATLKVLGRKNGRIILQPRNPNYEIITPEQLEIRGKFIGLIRQASK